MQRRVLVLDDDENLLDILDILLSESAGKDPVCVASYEALTARRSEALGCDVALLDVNLGAGLPSGLDALRWLRDEGFAGPILFFTGHAHTHPLVRDAIEAGEARVLTKPVASDVLLRALDDACT